MKNNKPIVLVLAALITVSPSSFAGGPASGGASIWDQIIQEGQLLDGNANTAMALEQHIIQTEQWILSLEHNPLGTIFPNLYPLIAGAEQINSLGHQIVTDASSIDKNFLAQFNDPRAQEFGVHFGLRQNPVLEALNTSLDSDALRTVTPQTHQKKITDLQATLTGNTGTVGAIEATGMIQTEALAEAQRGNDAVIEHNKAMKTAEAARAADERDARLMRLRMNGYSLTEDQHF